MIFRKDSKRTIRVREKNMRNNIFLKHLYAILLVLAMFAGAMPATAIAQTGSAAATSKTDLESRLKSIEEKIEKRRAAFGIPGMGLAIVRNGEVIYSKGLGYKDFEKRIPATADTQFAIGSATKAFTALSVLMSADEGKVSLDDSPRKYLSYFKMADPETDKNMNVRDLLAHTSGLNRTDLAMITGQLNRRELIQVVGDAKPMAKLREKFFYQNIMYAAAGEVVAQVQKTPWEKFVPARIFKPLAMNNSTMSLAEMQKAKDYSFGYEYNFDTKETRRLPFREIGEVAPAGSINSSANDMAKWINFVLDKGMIGGKRLVSEKSFDEWTKKQMNVTPNGSVAYGLGWFIQELKGKKIVQHGGNIDGFNSMVAMMPDEKIGFVMLTNVSGSPLGNELMQIVFSGLLDEPAMATVTPTAKTESIDETGKYKFTEAGFDIEVKTIDGKLTAVIPGQPNYTLENVGGRKYKLLGAPEGFFITFKDDSLFLEQPQGNFTLPKAGRTNNPAVSVSARALVGQYKMKQGAAMIEIKLENDGRVTLNIAGQQPYTLGDKGPNEYSLTPMPPTYSLKAKPDSTTKISVVAIVQPEGEFEFERIESKPEDAVTISVDELMAKAIEAAGGEANLRKIKSRVTTADVDFVHQGVKAIGTTFSKAPNMVKNEVTMTALGKTIAKGYDLFDGTNGEEVYTFSPIEKYAGKKLEDARISSDFYNAVNWKTHFPKVEIKGKEKVDDEECYVVEMTPEKGSRVTALYSTKTFLLIQQRGTIPSSTSSQNLPYKTTYSDYRVVDGVMIAFRSVSESPSMGDIVTLLKSVRHDVDIPDSTFKSSTPTLK